MGDLCIHCAASAIQAMAYFSVAESNKEARNGRPEPLWLSSDYNPHSGFKLLHTPCMVCSGGPVVTAIHNFFSHLVTSLK